MRYSIEAGRHRKHGINERVARITIKSERVSEAKALARLAGALVDGKSGILGMIALFDLTKDELVQVFGDALARRNLRAEAEEAACRP